MKIFIPIKQISQRVPGKNFRLFDGVPLYKRTLYKLKKFDVFVDTDSDDVIKEVKRDKKLSHVTVYKRDLSLRGHQTSVCELIRFFVEKFDLNNETICQIHVTSPFLEAETLIAATNMIQEGRESIVSCNSVQARLWRKEKYGMCPINHNPMKLEQTQDLPTYYEENSLFYIFNSNTILRTGNRIGNKPHFYITDFPENLDIDTEEDWSLAERMIIS